MREGMRWGVQLVMIVLIFALISISMNLLIEMRLLQIRMDRIDPLIEEKTYNQI